MAASDELQKVLNNYTKELGLAVVDQDIDVHIRLGEAADRSRIANIMANAWQTAQQSDKNMRIKYAYILLGVFAAQLIFMDYCFYKIGKAELKLDQWVVQA